MSWGEEKTLLREPVAGEGTSRDNPDGGRRPLHEMAVARLADMIAEGELESGTRLPERILCEKLGISRTPLREALKVLAADGLVELHPNRGATVARLTVADVDEMFPVMGALEALSGELACACVSEDQLAEIRALHYQMVLHFRRRERAPYFRLNQAIHAKILEAANNPLLSRLYRTVALRIRRARYFANLSQERWAEAVDEHEAILHALEARDGARLAAVLRNHLANKCAHIRAMLAAEDARETTNRLGRRADA